VLHRAQWTAVCNSVEDMHARVAAKEARAELQRLQRGRAGNNRHQTPTKGGGAASGSVARGRSPPSAATPPSVLSGAASPAANNSPSRGGGGAPASGAVISAITPVAALSSPASPSLGVHHSASRGAHFFSDRDEDENEDDDLDGAASLSFLHRHHRHLSAEHQRDGGGGVPRLALLSERPAEMSADFFELECIGYSEFTELQHVMLERRHFADAPDDESDAAQSFQLLRALSSCFSAAFRLVLQEQQLAAALAGSKRKKKKIDPSELPPVYPDKTTVLRFKDFRALFLANERIAGKLLPFILAAVVDQYGSVPGYSRWRVKAPLSAYL
jgi:hypothetical protein